MCVENINVLVGENSISYYTIIESEIDFMDIVDYRCLVANYFLNNIFK
jgi:hypothetical protein